MLTLKKGKFYRDGQVVPLEFGNKEQIKLMEDQLRIARAFEDEANHVDVEIEVTYHAKTEFKCSCGQTVWFEAESDYSDDDAESELVGQESSCHVCKNRYSINKQDSQFFVAKVKEG